MNTQHTPGPWHLSESQRTKFFGYDTQVHAISSEDALIAAVPAQSNAHLIAAAPDMLAALQAIRNLPGPDSHQSDEFRRGWLSALQAAYDLMPSLAKAVQS